MRAATALAALFFLFLPSSASADIILVDVNGGGDYLSIGEGVLAAVEGDTVLIAPGLYAGADNRVINPGTKNLAIIGLAGPDSTIVDCEEQGRAFIFSGGQDSTTVVRGLTLTNGLSFNGGAVYCEGSSPSFEQCVIRDSRSIGINTGGGGLYVHDGSPRIADCSFIDNVAGFGGGMASRGVSSPFLENVLFEGNEGESTGGLQCGVGSVTVVSCTFRDNSANDTGGGLGLLSGGPFLVFDSLFHGNTAGDGRGGGLITEGSATGISGSTFTGNVGSDGAAIVSASGANLTVTNTIIAFNEGRGVRCTGSVATFSRCCVFGNTGGGGLPAGQEDILFVDPFFCARLHGDFTLYDISQCLPANNEWGELVGVLGLGCEHPGPPDSPLGVSAFSRVDTVFVSWRAVSDTLVDHYSVERDTSSLFGPGAVVASAWDTTLVDAPLDDGIEYFYRVFAVDRFGIESAPSETVSCYVELIPPSAPTGLETDVGHRSATLSWTENPEPDLDYYRVYRGTVAGFEPGEPYVSVDEPAFTDTAVANYLSYYYLVSAVDFDDVESELSDEVRAVPHGIPPIVEGLAAEPGDSSATVTWDALDPACQEHFRVYRDTTAEMVDPAGLRDGFEQDDAGLPPSSPPWSVIEQDGTKARVTSSEHGVGDRSLAVRDSSTGYTRLFAYIGDGASAPRARFRVRPGSSAEAGPSRAGRTGENLIQFELFTQDGIGYPAGVLEVFEGSLRHWVAGSDPETLAACTPGEWHEIKWNLDCAADTYGVWLDGERIAEGVSFYNEASEIEIFQIRTRPLESCEAWVDEIMVGDHLGFAATTFDTILIDAPLDNGVTYYYKVSVMDTFGATGPRSGLVSVVPGMVGVDDPAADPERLAEVRFGRPNPFSSGTALSFSVPDPGSRVRIAVYDVSGRLVRSLLDTWLLGGAHTAAWDGRTADGAEVASGVYFIRVAIGEHKATRKAVLLRE